MVLTLLLAIVGAGCNRHSKNSKSLAIAVIPQGSTHEYWKSIHAGAVKAARLLRSRELEAEVIREDLRHYDPPHRFDVLLAVNSIQFLGAEGAACLRKLIAAVAPGGVCGVSFFARPDGDRELGRSRTGLGTRDGKTGEIVQGLWLLTMEELLACFAGWQMLEAARVWQWNPHTNRPQLFVTLIAHNVPAGDPPLPVP